MITNVANKVTGVSSVLGQPQQKSQQQAGRFATHNQLFSSFQQLVLDMQSKVLDQSNTPLTASRDVARLERPKEPAGSTWRNDATATDTRRDTNDDRSYDTSRSRTKDRSDAHSVARRDNASASDGNDRRDDAASTADDRNDTAAAADSGKRDDRQDASSKDGDSTRDDKVQRKDGKDKTKAAEGKSGDHQNAQGDTKGEAKGTLAAEVQAAISSGEQGTLLAKLVAQSLNTNSGGKEVAEVTKSKGEAVADTTKQSADVVKSDNHNLAQAAQQAKALRNIAALHTNGQANGEGAKQADTLLKAQAGEIAKSAGADANLKVNVNVVDDAALQNGKPLAALAAATAIAATDGDQAGQTKGQQAEVRQQAQVQNPLVQAAVVQSHESAAQGQAIKTVVQNGPAAQAQATQQISAESKGPVQASSGATNSGTHSGTGAGDGAASDTTSNTGDAQSARQSQQAQKTAQQQLPQQVARNKVLDQVSVQINKAIKAGADKINIRLSPQHLGRVEVKLEVAHDGRTVATVTADRPETLDMLKRDSDQLAKALTDAGLDMQAGDLNYNLKGQDGGKEQNGMASNVPTGGEAKEDDTQLAPMDTAVAAHELGILHNGRIDVRA